MRCHKPNTDQAVEFTVLVNGLPCDEYALPFAPSNDQNTVECFIPVTIGDHLTISGSFTGSILHGAFDVLADGSFVADRRIEGPKTGEVKLHSKRKIDFNAFLDAPKKEGGTTIFPPEEVVEGSLHVSALGDDHNRGPLLGTKDCRLSVGSLAVVVSLNRGADENYANKYGSMTCGDWRTWHDHRRKDAGIKAMYQLEVKETNAEISGARQQKHKRHYSQTRSGSQPWAKLVFHYRSAGAIKRAGCERMEAKSHALEAPRDTTLVNSPHIEKKPSSKTTKKNRHPAGRDRLAVASHAGSADSIFMTPAPEGQSKRKHVGTPSAPLKQSETSTLALLNPSDSSSPSVRKKKLFGQSLPSNAKLHAIAQQTAAQPADNDFDFLVEEYRKERENEDIFALFNRQLEEQDEQTAHEVSRVLDMSDEELADAWTATERFRVDPTSGGPSHALTQHEHLIDHGSNGASANSPEVTATASSKPPGDAYHMVEVKQEPIDDPFITSSNAQILDSQPEHATASQGNEPVTDAAKEAHHTIESSINEKVAKPSATPNQNFTPEHPRPLTPPTSISTKRAYSATMASRESTPSKKLRFTELNSKKAELLKRLEESKQRKAAAQQAFEEQQRLREEEERKREEMEMREIEMLERMAAEENEEYEQLVRAREAEENAVQEARRARERAEVFLSAIEEA